MNSKNYKINTKHKQNISDIINLIANNILNAQGNGTYNTQRQSIKKIFEQTSGNNYNRQGIELRLIVIDSLYSTNMSKRYFAFDELGEAILSLGKTEKEVIDKVISFRNNPEKENSELYEIFENKKYGIHKNGETAGEAKSLLSKYFYFQMMSRKDDVLGFPIYDSLAKNMYKPVWKYLGLRNPSSFKNKDVDIIEFIKSFKKLSDELEIKQISNLQCFDLLDAYLWRMGKFSEANFSLLLDKTDYIKLIKSFGLFNYEKENKDSDNLNKLLKAQMKVEYKRILDNSYFNTLWKHWLSLISE